jgi:putative tricarboxylic transport membrane protein
MTDQAIDPAQQAADPAPRAAAILPRKVNLRRGGLAVAGALAVTGLLFIWQSALLNLGNIGLPGPGFFPLVLAILVVAFAGIIAVERWRTPSDETIELGHRDVLIVMAACLVVPLLFEPLGAYLTLGLFGAVLLVLIARVSPWLAVVSAAIGMAGCWYFFQVLLGLSLPMGPF